MYALGSVLAALSLLAAGSAAQTCSSPVDVTVLGTGTPGASGKPKLSNVGAPLLGNPYHVELEHGAPGSFGLVLASANMVDVFLPAFGGTLYVGGPLLVIQSFALDGEGGSPPLLSLGTVAPSLCGFVAVAQAAVLDGGASGGWALTNGLRVSFGVSVGPLFHGQEYVTGGKPDELGIGDLDEDGIADVMAANTLYGNLGLLIGRGDGTFEDTVTLDPSLIDAEALELADFNGDGHLDAAVGEGSVDRVTVTYGAGDGTFGAFHAYGTDYCFGLALGDLDMDGQLDLAASNYDAGTASVLLNLGDGTFAPGVSYATDLQPYDVAVADFDADGDPDLASANNFTNSVTILLNAGAGAFSPGIPVAVGEGPRSLAVEDLDHDGIEDLVVGNQLGDTVSVLISQGDGTFAQTTLEPAHVVGVAIADFDEDGVPDLAVCDSADGDVTIWLGLGGGAFEGPFPVPVGAPTFVAPKDLDGDGHLDLAIGGAGVAIRLGLGNGLFRQPDVVPLFSNSLGLATADVDGDGYEDVVVASKGSNELMLLEGMPGGLLAPPIFLPEVSWSGYVDVVTADMDGSGTLDVVGVSDDGGHVSVYPSKSAGTFSPGLKFDQSGSPQAILAADLDGDGLPDVLLPAESSDKLFVRLGTGGGQLAPAVGYAAGNGPRDVDVADLDADGFLDAVVPNRLQPGVTSVFLGNGDGTFTITPGLSDYGGTTVDLADLDADGVQDMVSAHVYVFVRLGLGGAAFGPAQVYHLDGEAHAVIVAELTADGTLDVAVTPSTPARMSVMPGTGDGTFDAPQHFAGAKANPNFAASMATLDVDQDGLLDVVAPATQHDGIVVYRNQLLK